MLYRTTVSSIGLLAALLPSFVPAKLVQAADRAGTQPRGWQMPRTFDGRPSFEGTWTNATLTPLIRPDHFGERHLLTEAEAREIEIAHAKYVTDAAQPTDLSRDEMAHKCAGFVAVECVYNFFWFDFGSRVVEINGERRTSLIIDPPNGQLPPLIDERRNVLASEAPSLDGPEALSLYERCLLATGGSSSGPPMLPVEYNNHHQIVQTNDSMLILVEMIHDARIIRLGGEHVPPKVRKWMGDSIGRWDGDSLVVETINFTDKESFLGSTEHKKVTERFTLIGPDTLLYRFTVEDPATYSRPFTGELPFRRVDELIYEYACHEGNYALPNMLAAARKEEQETR